MLAKREPGVEAVAVGSREGCSLDAFISRGATRHWQTRSGLRGPQEGFVTYTEDLDLNPRTVGIVRKRWFTFDGPDRLKLTIDAAERGANLQDSSLIWERVRSK
jgi:hypothetical protein